MRERDAITFARFIIEEKDENKPDETVVSYDPSRKIDLQRVIVKLMSNSLYPLMFHDSHEAGTREAFTKAFDKNKDPFIKEI